jgi:hypothetical protein
MSPFCGFCGSFSDDQPHRSQIRNAQVARAWGDLNDAGRQKILCPPRWRPCFRQDPRRSRLAKAGGLTRPPGPRIERARADADTAEGAGFW